MNNVKVGDRVYAVCYSSFRKEEIDDQGEAIVKRILQEPHVTGWDVDFINGRNNQTLAIADGDYIVPIEVYNSPLYKIMRENK